MDLNLKNKTAFISGSTSGIGYTTAKILLQEGMKVEHPKFGYGTIIALDQSGASRKAKVEFKDYGEKTLLLSFAKLKIHQ